MKRILMASIAHTLWLLLLTCSSALVPVPTLGLRQNNHALRKDSSAHSFARNSSGEVPRGGSLYTHASILSSIKLGFSQRLAADPSFLSKSILEIILAAATQYAAEVGRRGKHRILPEIDFVAAGVLTAVLGKYYSMWKVAKTVDNVAKSTADDNDERTNWKDRIPTNVFQPTLLDGSTKPTVASRFLALLLPMPELFRAGFIASIVGYGLTAVLIQLRTMLRPQYIAPTVPVSIIGASIYTGSFMAIVSNIRYQLLQGVVEPIMIEKSFLKMTTLGEKLKDHTGIVGFAGILMRWNGWSKFKGLVIFLVRWANGLLGSYIAITGMRYFGLQKLKETP